MRTYIFPSSRFGIVAPSFQGNRTVPIRAQRAMAESEAFAVLDGPMFAFCGSQSREECVQSVRLLLDQKRGLYVPSSHPSEGMTISIVDGRAQMARGASVPNGATVAVQLFPELVRDRIVVASRIRDTENVWRAALGILPNGNLIFAVDQAPMHIFATRLKALGVVHAGYTDGGGSAKLVTREWYAGDREDRPKGAWLADLPEKHEEVSILLPLVLGAIVYYIAR